jgi:hypothetical protein
MILKLPDRVLYQKVDIEVFEESCLSTSTMPWLHRLGATENVAFRLHIQHCELR